MSALACLVLGAPEPSLPGETPALAASSYGELPLRFEPNLGQTDSRAKFLARGDGYTLFLTASEALIAVPGSAGLRMKLHKGNPSPEVSGEARLPGRSNYFLGDDPNQWRTGIPHYAKVRYEEVYPGIDLVYYGRQGQLEYDFVVAPGADPGQIALAFDGAEAIEIDAAGDLVIDTTGGPLRQRKPVVYQEIGGTRQHLAGDYVLLADRRIGFHLGDYDRTRPLVIDPVLIYSTYLGGEQFDLAIGIGVDGAGNAYIGGYTESINFPLLEPTQPLPIVLGDVFVVKLSPNGTSVIYSTYFGGTGNDFTYDLAVDAGGHAYVIGSTESLDFPTVGAVQNTHAGGPLDVFVVKLAPDGSSMRYSTYLGGTGIDDGLSIAADASGNAYLAGVTESTNFPTTSFQNTHGGGEDAFAAKLNADGTQLVYSTFLGGSDDDLAYAITVDASGHAYLTGRTRSTNFPTANPFQANHAPGLSDAFVTKLNPSGDGLVFSTYFGGGAYDAGGGIAVDGGGYVNIVGTTSSSDFPTASYQETYGGVADAFVAKFTPSGTALVYSTYLGGDDRESGNGIALDAAGNAYVVGSTDSANFPTANAGLLQSTFAGVTDAFLTKLNATGSSLIYSTFGGGSGDDRALGVAADAAGNVYVVGRTNSTDYFDQVSLQPFGGGILDGFIVKVSDAGGGGDDVVTTVSAANYERGAVARESIVAAFGLDMATGEASAISLPLPTELAGTTLTVTDSGGMARPAELLYCSAGQINFLIPDGTALGLATIRVVNGDGRVVTGTVQIDAVAPGVFSADNTGTGVAAASYLRVREDDSREEKLVFDPNTVAPVAIDLGPATDQVYLILYGTGIRGYTSEVTATVDGEDVAVLGAMEQGLYAGLDQVNIGPLPRSLLGRGVVDVVLTVDGKPSNAVTVQIAAGPSSSFVISNLNAGPSVNGFVEATLPFTVDFSDPSGSASNGPVKLTVVLYSGQLTITSTRTPEGVSPGQTQGTMRFQLSLGDNFAPGSTVPITVTLENEAGVRSNTLTGTFRTS